MYDDLLRLLMYTLPSAVPALPDPRPQDVIATPATNLTSGEPSSGSSAQLVPQPVSAVNDVAAVPSFNSSVQLHTPSAPGPAGEELGSTDQVGTAVAVNPSVRPAFLDRNGKST